MKKTFARLVFAAFCASPFAFSTSCKTSSDAYKKLDQRPEFIHASVRRIVDIIRHDIFAPPIASRIYAYSTVAAYEALVPGSSERASLAGKLTGLETFPKPEAGRDHCWSLASATACLKVGKALVFSEGDVTELEAEMLADFHKMQMPDDVWARSTAFGEAIAKHVLAWAKKDNYAQLRSAPKFTINTDDIARWKPTPPMYADALEPSWNKMRPWVLDSASQFKPARPTAFSTKKGSDFWKLADDVRSTVKNLTPEQVATAWYWDDNPFAAEVSGHVTFARKKISPAGHWMCIVGYASQKSSKSAIEAAEAYALTALAVADGFIACWDEKYRSCLLRPETFINQYIDPEWLPLIQTPPFPEHTSGHSTISMAAATVLEGLFGQNFAFTDSTEVEFGMEPRSFPSFRAAAEEVGQSRLFGGIHFRTGNLEGLKCGEKVGAFVLQKAKTRQ